MHEGVRETTIGIDDDEFLNRTSGAIERAAGRIGSHPNRRVQRRRAGETNVTANRPDFGLGRHRGQHEAEADRDAGYGGEER